MPLFATLVGSLASGIVALLSRFMGFGLALKLAAYSTWIVVFGVFVTTVFVCTQALVSGFSSMFGAGGGSGAGGKIVSWFAMAVGMFIPSNAAAVMACVASVWIACQIYKVQKQGMHHYSK